MSLLEDVRYQFRTGSVLMQLIYVNSGIFLALMLVRLVFHLSGEELAFRPLMALMSVPSSPSVLVSRPWTVITHMFVHQEFLHVLFNMLWLHFGGRVFLVFFNNRQLLSTYVLGGLVGALAFMLAYNLFPVYAPMADAGRAIGASGAVLAILVAAATIAPDYVIRLVLIGPVRLKYIALFIVMLDLLFIPDGNAGGHFGHLGGAAFGFLYASLLKRGTDLTVDFLRPWRWLRAKAEARGRHVKVVHRRAETDSDYIDRKATRQEQVDAILDKIKASGYESLSKKEKELLFKASQEI